MNLTTDKNSHLNYFMSNKKRIPRNHKQSILETVYDIGIKEYHYSLLDLLMGFRYVIREKKEEFDALFNIYKINFRSKVIGVTSFEDAEYIFYEGLYFPISILIT